MLPFVTGKYFFLVSPTEAAAAEFLNGFPNDKDGVPRVYTTWDAVIAACQADTGADAIVISPLFTTAPTDAQKDALNAANAVTVQAGLDLPDGSYLATKAPASFATATTISLFQVNGRVQLLDLVGEVATTIGAAQTTKFTFVPTVGSTTDLCAQANIANLAAGASLLITGTPSAALVATTQGAVANQASVLQLKAGTIQLVNAATSSGNVRVRVRYRSLEPGASISAL